MVRTKVKLKQGDETMKNEAMRKSDRRVSGTKEWAHFTMSGFRGCGNACAYCCALADKIRLGLASNAAAGVDR